MNEGEKSKGNKKKGDSVTFRLLKKMKYSNDVIELINDSINNGKCNEEILRAIDFYTKYKHREKEIELYTHFMDKLENPSLFSEKVMEKLYVEFVNEKINLSKDQQLQVQNELLTQDIDRDKKEDKEQNLLMLKEIEPKDSREELAADNIIKVHEWNNTDEESEIFETMGLPQSDASNGSNVEQRTGSISRALSSMRRRR